MSDVKPELEDVSVVLVGSFNPAIFHPTWFAREKLIQQEEADRADIKIVSPEVSVFSIGWLQLEVTLDRFAARTSQIQNLEPLRDLVRGHVRVAAPHARKANGHQSAGAISESG